jgi:uncharacterized membrane protein
MVVIAPVTKPEKAAARYGATMDAISRRRLLMVWICVLIIYAAPA